MPLVAPAVYSRVRQHNLTVSARSGATITAGGTAHVMGAWASLIDPVDEASYLLAIRAADVETAAADTSMLMDLGIGPSGGGSEVVILPFLDLGAADASISGMGKFWEFPVNISKGVRLSARAQSAIVSDTVTIAVYLHQRSLYPLPVSRWKEYGSVATSSRGTLVAPGNGAFGSWVSVGVTTTRRHNYWTVGYDQGGDVTLANAGGVLVELGYEVGAERLIGQFMFRQTNSEDLAGPFPSSPLYHPVPSGVQMRVRIASAETENRGIIIYAGD